MIENFMKELKRKGLTQDQIAAMTGLSQAVISKCSRGNDPQASTLIKLADAFNVTIDHILERDKISAKAA